MKVIQHLTGETEVKTAQQQYQIWDNDSEFKGSLYFNRANLIWCKGRTQRDNGKRISWKDFIKYMES